jgi:DNA-binding MarR family transcriptional regulator
MIVKLVSNRYQLGMIDEPNTPDEIAELLVHVGRAAQSEGARSDLTAAQWTCLRFFARANGSSRTPSAFASFQATTRGTASQIIKSLERRGLVTRTRSTRDRRSVCFDLTEDGRHLLAQDPLRKLVRLIDGFGDGESARFLMTLSRLSSALAAQRAVPAFGTCRDCRHCATSGERAYCACMAAELAADEMHKLCVSYTPAHAVASQGERDGAA